jgi:hypothetical protein
MYPKIVGLEFNLQGEKIKNILFVLIELSVLAVFVYFAPTAALYYSEIRM